MKAILRTNKKLSLKLKAVMALFIFVGVIAFLFSLKFSGKKKELPDLNFLKDLKAPECNSPGGFYKNNFNVKLTSSDSDTKIYYTLDGSEPSLKSAIYTEPIVIKDRTEERNYLSAIPTSPRWKPPVDNVFKGTILRAITVDEKNNKSAELIRSFFVNENGRERYSMPVISITVNEKDLFGFNKGIYVLGKTYTDKDNYIKKNIPLELPWWEYPSNYLLRGNDAERPAHVEFYETSNALGFEANVGIRINGNATRGFAQKSLRICFREKYGKMDLNYDLFPSNPVKKFNSFILRNSGNDWDKTMFRDAFMQSLMKFTSVDIQDYRPSIVFINGEYWGIHNIRERFDENYLSNKYHISVDSLTILELGGGLVHGKKGEEDQFAKLLAFVKANDLSKQENYDYLKSKIDLESLSDFVIANVYFCNSDWPNNNVKFWRFNGENCDARGIRDGRWRWMLYDTDWGFGYSSKNSFELNLLDKAQKIGSIGVIFGGLIKNRSFKKEFIDRFQFHLDNTFNTDTLIKKIDQFASELKPGMEEHISRWRVMGSYNNWLGNVNELKEFAKNRHDIQIQQLNEFKK